MDFRDQIVQDELKRIVGPYRPEKSLRQRLARMAVILVLAFAAVAGLMAILEHSTPRPAAPPAKAKPRPVEIQLVPAPEKAR